MQTVTVDSEYKKNKDLRKEDVMVLKEWAEKQPHLPPVSELHLIFFLHSCYYSIEMAKTTIESFFTYRTHCPEMFRHRDLTSSKFRNHLEVADFLFLTPKTSSGDQILVFRLIDCEVAKFDFNEQIKIFDMSIVQWLMQYGTSEGLLIVADFEGAKLGHILKFNIVTMRKLLLYMQDALFIRLKSFHFINAGSYMDMLMNMFKPFLKRDLINSLHFHTESIRSLYQYIPIECLPSNYGGSQPSLNELHESKINTLMAYADYFTEDDSYIADETKRVGKPALLSEIFGVEGSFKKLDID
ncbi:hypothetical protein RI129_012478 [Pyrocoelia pectoralis]|uniref:CRAL-TRIO domain-containing protein n=1 Tax=Pyrocoelia pectoralis TaxID=417401 RepID=A0AAN7ZG26_9COLE